ncbi:MAG: pyruvate dehydrogenase E2 component (dihydrolipoamide acetyltransferase) [Phenylobacterium sp.]|jgi:pyruvate dehydrogenase E2 component (dihydrolipoamide acetyltransferase)
MTNIIDVQVPDVGDDAVEVIELCVAVGDVVEAEDSLIVVETDKATMDIPSPESGTISGITVAVGDKVSQGSLIVKLTISAGDAVESAPEATPEAMPEVTAPVVEEAPAAAPAPQAAPAVSVAVPAASEIIEVTVPDIGSDEAVDVIEVLVKVGDTISKEDGLVTVETDKATMDVPSMAAGVVKEVKVSTGDKVQLGSVLVMLEVAGSVAATPAAATATAAAPTAPVGATAPSKQKPNEKKAPPVPHHPMARAGSIGSGKVYASPSVRRVASEYGVDMTKVKGSGRKSRILKEDVQAYVKYELSRPKATAAANISSGSGGLQLIAPPKVDFSKFGEIEEKPLTRIQKISGPNLHRNWVTIPHVTQFDEADITDVEAFRKEQNALGKKQKSEVKITPLVFIMKAVAKSLEAFPVFNSSLAADGEHLVMKQYVHIGIAVDTPNGLVVPVVRDVNKKGIYDLSRELMDISVKARDGKLKAQDMQGGCMTISSLGGIGGTAFTPIINAPEVAILGVSKSEIKPKWDGEAFQPRLMLPLSLSYDHRVVDGALAARFSVYLSALMSDIRKLIL